MTPTTNPYPKFTHAWFQWNCRKAGRAGTGPSKARPLSRKRSLAMLAKRKTFRKLTRAESLAMLAKRRDRQAKIARAPETDPYSGT